MEILERNFIVRHDKKSKNSFVRLPPTTAQALWRDALRDVAPRVDTTRTPRRSRSTDATPPPSSVSSCWRVAEEQGISTKVTSGIEFLPLEIRSASDDRVVYASYNGGDAVDGKFHDLSLHLLLRESHDYMHYQRSNDESVP